MKWLNKKMWKNIVALIMLILIVSITGCSQHSLNIQSIDGENINFEDELNSEEEFIEAKSRVPKEPQFQIGDKLYDTENTVYYKTYYDDFVRGLVMSMRFPDINLKAELEDYFEESEYTFDILDEIVEMFYDHRSIEIEEEILKALFYSHNYEIYFHNQQINSIQVRLIEIREIDGLSIYPSRILIQTWDEESIYLQDITGPIPRKLRTILTIDNKEELKLIIHSSGLSVDYCLEEELSFWSYRGSYWVLEQIELEIDASEAHNAGVMYPDVDRNELYTPTYYLDGIVYQTSKQGDGLHSYTYRLGKMVEIEKNKIFRLNSVYESVGRTIESGGYIEFEIK